MEPLLLLLNTTALVFKYGCFSDWCQYPYKYCDREKTKRYCVACSQWVCGEDDILVGCRYNCSRDPTQIAGELEALFPGFRNALSGYPGVKPESSHGWDSDVFYPLLVLSIVAAVVIIALVLVIVFLKRSRRRLVADYNEQKIMLQTMQPDSVTIETKQPAKPSGDEASTLLMKTMDDVPNVVDKRANKTESPVLPEDNGRRQPFNDIPPVDPVEPTKHKVATSKSVYKPMEHKIRTCNS